MLWANRYRNMDVDLEDGTEVILEGDIDYWVEGGKIDLKPWEVIVVGDGDQAAAVERLRSELEERGWFDDEQKQRPPAFPERVGVVTSYVAMPGTTSRTRSTNRTRPLTS